MKLLVRHFLIGLVRPANSAGDDAGAPVAQLIGLLLAISWFIPGYGFYDRYLILQSMPSGKPYLLAYSSDALLISVILMIVVAVVTVLKWPDLFLSRLDWLVLGPLPVSRMTLATAKAFAVAVFMTVIIVALTTFACVVIPGVASGPWEPRPLGIRIVAYGAMLYGTGFFTFLCLLATQGIMSAVLPERMWSAVAFVMRSVLLLSVVCAFPLFPYFPVKHAVVDQSSWLLSLPAAWFWGFGEWVTGTRTEFAVALAKRAAIALPAAALMAAMAYLISFLQTEKLSAEPGRRSKPVDPAHWMERLFPSERAAAIAGFIARTMARSREHATSLVLSSGIGVALALESFVYLSVRGHFDRGNAAFVETVITLPLTLSFFFMLGMRRAFCICSEAGANWMFRFLEAANARAKQLNVVHFYILVVAGWLTILLCAPLFVKVAGWQGLLASGVEMLLACALAEYLLLDWKAIPFTRAANPARMHLVWRIVKHLIELAFYVFIGSSWVFRGLSNLRVMGGFALIVFVVFVLLRQRRLRDWGNSPLEFEEPGPEVLQEFKLA